MKFFVCLFYLFGTVLLWPGPLAAVASSDAAALGKQRVAVAGRQRMLSQSIAKSKCLAILHPNVVTYDRDSEQAASQFSAASKVLREGGGTYDFPPEVSPKVLDVLSEMQAVFESSPLSQSSSGSTGSASVRSLAESSAQVLEAAKAATSVVRKYHASSSAHPAKIRTVDMAGRQRMLTQKLAKDVCFLAMGYRSQETVASISGTLDLFESSMEALVSGDYELRIPEQSSPIIRQAFRAYLDDWSPIHARLQTIVLRGTATPQDAIEVADDLDGALKRMQRIVEMY